MYKNEILQQCHDKIYLKSDVKVLCYTVGSPFEDRTITADEDPSMDVILNEINRQYRTQQAPWSKKTEQTV